MSSYERANAHTIHWHTSKLSLTELPNCRFRPAIEVYCENHCKILDQMVQALIDKEELQKANLEAMLQGHGIAVGKPKIEGIRVG